MATMYPAVVPDYVRADPYRGAEISVYEHLRDQLPAPYVCYYSRPWLGLTAQGEEREGEADFVVAHPALGFLVIEVKGGGVSRKAETEEWFSTNRLGITNRIKDPFQQASRSKHALLAKLKEQPGWASRFVTARHGVIFPDCSRPRHALGANMPQWLSAYGEDLGHLRTWVQDRLAGRDDEAESAGRGLGNEGMATLHQLLAASFELRPSLSRALSEDARTVERLTQEQFDILTSLESFQQMAIAGGAGTGKTLLALEKACRLGEAGSHTLLVCYNEALAEELSKLTRAAPNVTAASFHSLCGRMASIAGVDLSAVEGKAQLFGTALPDALMEAMTQQEDLRFDAVVVDEGQDFRDGWITALRLCLKDSDNGCFYVFYDDNQRVYGDAGSWLSEMPKARYPLTKNLRNTRAIHLSTKPWYSGRALRSAGPEGVPVEWIEVKRKENVAAAVRDSVADLTKRQKIVPGDIAILTAGRAEQHPLVVGGAIAGVRCVRAGQGSGKDLIFDTVRRFKGLERRVVLLIDVDELIEPELIYVGLSRPSVLLKVFGTHTALARIRNGGSSGSS